MSEREHQRIPYAVEVEFRTASSFLVAYSVNLSRGGLFLETEDVPDVGTEIAVKLAVPGSGSITVPGVVAWRRGRESTDGPPGLGVEFTQLAPQLGGIIDRLVAAFEGISVLLLAPDRVDRTSLTRVIRSILGTADVVSAGDARVAETLLTGDIDLAVIDVDADPEGALSTLRQAKQVAPPVPSIALASTKKLREHARAAGADEVASNPPAFSELQVLLVRALGRPMSVR
ncbi:MAG: TIGR02266 family protein [Kofleriaceae bacterium]|nr:TIGR02266 family protein [Myxococcales bacterium]MCB9563531.1 TIGR02266 family protein [Kofleriaceae bacterium]